MEASSSQGQNVQNSSIGKASPPQMLQPLKIQEANSTRNQLTNALSLSCHTTECVHVCASQRERGNICSCLVVNRTIGNVCPLQRMSRERDSSRVCICRGDFSSPGVGVMIALSLKTQTQQSVSTRTETLFHLSSTSLPTKQTDSRRKRGMNTHTLTFQLVLWHVRSCLSSSGSSEITGKKHFSSFLLICRSFSAFPMTYVLILSLSI